jgi:hypothetical protein
MYDLRQIQTLFASISNEKDRSNIYPFLSQEVYPLLQGNNIAEAIKRVEQAIATETLLDKSVAQISLLRDVYNLITKLT